MSGVRVYMEGGGQSKETRGPLRAGMEQFLREFKERARAKRWSFQVIACGGRNDTRDAFEHANRQYPDAVNLLLVDAEAAVVSTPLTHLQRDLDLSGVEENKVHLMAQMMEAWIVADVETLRGFYGQDFMANALPKAANLETVSKADLDRALEQATRRSSKGKYHKTQHAGRLLERIDPSLSRNRCPHCERLFSTLNDLLTQ